jgi:hypothetical protein
MKKYIIGLLVLAFIVEAILTFLCFFMPAKAMELFGMQYNEQLSFLGYIIAWFLLLVSVFILYTIYLVKKDIVLAKHMINILGCWWVALGIGVYFAFGKIDNLLLDSSKGVILLVLNYFNAKENK